MKKLFLIASLTGVCLFTTNCASIVSSATYPLSINSNPSGASITIINKKGTEVYKGTTPASVVLKAGAGFFSKEEYSVKFSKDGYQEKTVPVNFKIDGWYWGNILLGGLIGMLIVDPATGAMWKIDSKFMNETLSQNTASTKPLFEILEIKDIPENWKKHLVRIN